MNVREIKAEEPNGTSSHNKTKQTRFPLQTKPSSNSPSPTIYFIISTAFILFTK
jgi:hypothetical protein